MQSRKSLEKVLRSPFSDGPFGKLAQNDQKKTILSVPKLP